MSRVHREKRQGYERDYQYRPLSEAADYAGYYRALIFLCLLVQIHLKAGSKFAERDLDTVCAAAASS